MTFPSPRDKLRKGLNPMAIFLLWFSIFGFTVLSIAVVISAFRYFRSRRPVQGIYLLLMTIFDLWLLIFTYLFFTEVYLRPIGAGVRLALGLVRTAVSAAVLYLFAYLAARLSKPGNRGIRNRSHLLFLIAPLLYCGVVLALLRRISLPVVGGVSTLYYGYLTILSLFANLRITRSSIRLPDNLAVFLRFSAAAFLCLLIVSLSYFLDFTGSLLSVLPRAAFCLLWGLAEIVVFMRRGYLSEKTAGRIHADFLQDFGITPREAEVIEQVGAGKSIRLIGKALFISEKTVETHLYNIYRKCSCRNRVELMNTLRRYL